MKSSIIHKFDKLVDSMRKALDENDGSTLQTISSGIKNGYDSLKDSFSSSEKAQTLWADIKKLSDDVAQAVKDGDKKLSSKTLSALEKKIREYKEEEEKEKQKKSAGEPEEPKAVEQGESGTSEHNASSDDQKPDE